MNFHQQLVLKNWMHRFFHGDDLQKLKERFDESLRKFLTFNEYKVLDDFGSVKRTRAEAKAFAEYDKFNRTQKITSDFDKAVKKLTSDQKESPES